MIIKPKIVCKNCKHMTRIMDSRTGKYYCQHMDKYVRRCRGNHPAKDIKINIRNNSIFEDMHQNI